MLERVKLYPFDITDKAVISFAENCSRLTHFALFMWPVREVLPVAVTDVAVEALARGCPNLVDVKFWDCTQLTDNSLFALARHCPNVEKLHFSDCAQITDSGVEQIARWCTSLRYLNLTGSGVTDVGVRALIEHCKKTPCVRYILRLRCLERLLGAA